MSTGRNKITLAEAAATWRALPERDRIETCMDVSHGTCPESPASIALLALADAAAAEPEAKDDTSEVAKARAAFVRALEDCGNASETNAAARMQALRFARRALDDAEEAARSHQ